MGASVAYRAGAGAAPSVTVLEAGRIGGGTSSCSFAWTNSNWQDAACLSRPERRGHEGARRAGRRVRRDAVVAWRRQRRMDGARGSRGAAGERGASAILGLCGRMDHTGATAGTRARHRSGTDRRCADRVLPRGGLARSGGVCGCDARRGAIARRVGDLRCPRVRNGRARWPGHGGEDGGRQAVRGRHGGELRRPLGERSGVGCRSASASGADRRVPRVHPAGCRPRRARRALADHPGKAGWCRTPRAALECDGRDARL